MLFVLDASVAASWLLADESNPNAATAFDRLVRESMIAPAIWWFEIRNMLVSNERRGRLDAMQLARALEMVRDVPVAIDRDPDSKVVVGLAQRHRLTIYDAAYLELAQRENVPLATLDRSLARAAEAEKIPLIG